MRLFLKEQQQLWNNSFMFIFSLFCVYESRNVLIIWKRQTFLHFLTFFLFVSFSLKISYFRDWLTSKGLSTPFMMLRWTSCFEVQHFWNIHKTKKVTEKCVSPDLNHDESDESIFFLSFHRLPRIECKC